MGSLSYTKIGWIWRDPSFGSCTTQPHYVLVWGRNYASPLLQDFSYASSAADRLSPTGF